MSPAAARPCPSPCHVKGGEKKKKKTRRRFPRSPPARGRHPVPITRDRGRGLRPTTSRTGWDASAIAPRQAGRATSVGKRHEGCLRISAASRTSARSTAIRAAFADGFFSGRGEFVV